MPPNGALQTAPGGALRTVSGGAASLRATAARRSSHLRATATRPLSPFVRRRAGGEAGQATVELVALLPLLVVVLAGAWQAVLAGHAAWAASAAARAAARAHAVGTDPTRAARTHLPGSLERGLRVTAGSDGDVEVRVRIPSLPGLPSPGHANAGARFEPQS